MDEHVLSHVLSSFLPPDLMKLVEQHVLLPGSPGQILYHNILLSTQRVYEASQPLLRPLIDCLLVLLEDHQGYIDVAVPLVFLFTVVLVMNWIRRLVMWCTRMALRAMFWSLVVVLGAFIWQRGVLESARDAAVVGAKIAGYVAVLKDVWVHEYKRYEGAQATGRWDEFSHTRGSTGRY